MAGHRPEKRRARRFPQANRISAPDEGFRGSTTNSARSVDSRIIDSPDRAHPAGGNWVYRLQPPIQSFDGAPLFAFDGGIAWRIVRAGATL